MQSVSSAMKTISSETFADTRPSEVDEGLEFTILMPCLNEAETIGICIEKAHQFIKGSNCKAEILIADNGSTDGSVELARSYGARVVSVPVRGYGAALTTGIENAGGKYVIMGDADDSYDFSDLEPFLQKLREGYDLVMGNRFRGGIEPGAMPTLHYYLGNPVLSFIGRLLFKIPVRDFHCGLRGFRRSSISDLRLRTTGMEFASEMVVRSALQGLTLAEVPTSLKQDGRSRPPHLKTWRDGWRHLKFLLMYSPKWLFFYPGFVLMALGAGLAALLMSGSVKIGSLELDFNSFLAACLFSIIGAQLVTFGALARYYAAITGMLPMGVNSSRILKWCNTDTMAQVAAVLILVGGVSFAASFAEWARTDFGPITSPLVPRVVAAGLSTMVIGVQTGFAGFLFGIFEIPKKGIG